MRKFFTHSPFWKSLFTRVFLTLLFLSVLTAGVFASPTPEGSLYENWIQKILVSPDSITVQRSHTIVDENGAEIARVAPSPKGKNVLVIGTDFATEDTLKIKGNDQDDAVLQVTALSGNPEISLGDTAGSHGSLYTNIDTGELRVWTGKKENGVLVGQNSLEISGAGNTARVHFPEKLQENGKNVVTVFQCAEDAGVLIGFDIDGNALCSNDSSKTSWVSVPTAEKYPCSVECGGGTVDFDVSCRSGDNYLVEEEDQVCIDLGLEKPLETRECNLHACK